MSPDAVVVGAGVIGLAVGRELARRGLRVCVLEKEASIASHQTGRNSGVLHTGIYYAPGSTKALTCRAGYAEMLTFASERGIALELCGKVIVAADESELERLEELHRRGRANGVRVSALNQSELGEIEPHATGIAALYVPEAGIIDYRAVAESFARDIIESGGEVVCNRRVEKIEPTGEDWLVHTEGGRIAAKSVVGCAGLHSDRVARSAGVEVPSRIVPFRGEYFRVGASGDHLCRGLIYPVPDPRFPFLGVHFTRTIDGGLLVGPNAVLALSREGYRWRDFRMADVWDAATYPGFLRLAARNLGTGMGEMHRSLSKDAFVRALQRLVPDVRADQLTPAPAGVRAQSLRRDGSLETEFVILGDRGQAHVCNAPSPGATSSIAIAAHVVDRVLGEKIAPEQAV